MRLRLWILPAVLCALPAAVSADRTELVFAFRNYQTQQPERMILVGEIQSKTKAPEAQVQGAQTAFPGLDTRLDQVTVKVQNRRGLKIGQKLYVIDKDPHHQRYRNGLIVGEIEVTQILNNPFYGWVLTGQGILLRVREGHFVARTLETENLERAYGLKKRGDHYRNRGDTERAVLSYNEALSADASLPEASAALGDLFYSPALRRRQEDAPLRALSYYERAWQNRVNFRYVYEEYSFYKSYARALLEAYRVRRLESAQEEQAVRLLDRVAEVAAAALGLRNQPEPRIDLAIAHYYRMRYYERQSNAQERSRRDESQRVVAENLQQLINGNVRNRDLYAIALLFYGEEELQLSRRSALGASEQERLARLRGLTRAIAPLYRQYAGVDADPEVLRLLDQLPSAH
ncbi:MAG: tetratricopeptide repeat protein [Leptospirales bacterium]|nr:tetratricopeptide repeat protein [Leptospirales bacterium]